MISQDVIYSVLIAIVLTGVIPLIGGIVLLAMGKIKGSSFWAGVLAFIIASIVTGIGAVIVAIPTAMNAMTSTDINIEDAMGQTIAVSVISAVILGFSMLILIKNCMKARTFKAAVSAGLGIGIPQLLTIAFGFVGMYMTFAQINSGAFDKNFEGLVKMGAMTKEQALTLVAESKAMYTVITVESIIAQILATAGNVLLMLAAAIIIMVFVTRRRAMVGTLIVIGGIGATSIVTSVITDLIVAGVIALAIGAAAFIFAYRMKNKIVVPEKPTVANDAFMQSIANAKEEK